MRIIFTILILLISLPGFTQENKGMDLQQGLTGKVGGLNVQTTNSGSSETRIFLRCGMRRPSNSSPLLIVDGEVKPLSELSAINPMDIISVEILKSAPATALYGPDGVNGAMFIKTILKKIVITDSLDNSGIAHASVEFYCKENDHRIQLAADDKGSFNPPALSRGFSYKMRISAVGYELHESWVNHKAITGKEINLKRIDVRMGEVVVSVISCRLRRRTITCGGQYITGCSVVKGIKMEEDSKLQENSTESVSVFRVYPNPAPKGSSVTVELNADRNSSKLLRILTVDGRMLWQQSIQLNKSTNSFRIPTQSSWSAGVYFIQLLYENGQPLASERIIIQ